MKKIYQIEISNYGELLDEYFYTNGKKAKFHFKAIKNIGRNDLNIVFREIPTCDDIPIEEIKSSVERWVL